MIRRLMTAFGAFVLTTPELSAGILKPREYEQRSIETKIVSEQLKIKSQLGHSEDSLDWVKSEILALAAEASATSLPDPETWRRRCETVRRLSDDELSQLIRFQVDLRQQQLSLSSPKFNDSIAQKVQAVGSSLLNSLDGRAGD